MLGVCPVVSHILEDKFNQNKNISLGAGALIGAATSATLTHPMDTIKTCNNVFQKHMDSGNKLFLL